MPKRKKQDTEKPMKQPKKAVKDLETRPGKSGDVKGGLKYGSEMK